MTTKEEKKTLLNKPPDIPAINKIVREIISELQDFFAYMYKEKGMKVPTKLQTKTKLLVSAVITHLNTLDIFPDSTAFLAFRFRPALEQQPSGASGKRALPSGSGTRTSPPRDKRHKGSLWVDEDEDEDEAEDEDEDEALNEALNKFEGKAGSSNDPVDLSTD